MLRRNIYMNRNGYVCDWAHARVQWSIIQLAGVLHPDANTDNSLSLHPQASDTRTDRRPPDLGHVALRTTSRPESHTLNCLS
jgi:hypothetical protein